MRIGICDDEQVQQELLIKYISTWGQTRDAQVEWVTYSSAESFLFAWEEDKDFDLLMLDVEMGKMNGMDLAMKIREQDEELPILFITGYEKYMAQGYEVAALHYLLKPVNQDKLFSILDKLYKRQQLTQEKILFQTDEATLSLYPKEIWYVEAKGHQCIVYTATQQYEVRHGFSEVKKRLDKELDKTFVQCHRSYLVNIRHTAALMKQELVLDNQVRIPISRGAHKQVNETFIRTFSYKDSVG